MNERPDLAANVYWSRKCVDMEADIYRLKQESEKIAESFAMYRHQVENPAYMRRVEQSAVERLLDSGIDRKTAENGVGWARTCTIPRVHIEDLVAKAMNWIEDEKLKKDESSTSDKPSPSLVESITSKPLFGPGCFSLCNKLSPDQRRPKIGPAPKRSKSLPRHFDSVRHLLDSGILEDHLQDDPYEDDLLRDGLKKVLENSSMYNLAEIEINEIFQEAWRKKIFQEYRNLKLKGYKTNAEVKWYLELIQMLKIYGINMDFKELDREKRMVFGRTAVSYEQQQRIWVEAERKSKKIMELADYYEICEQRCSLSNPIEERPKPSRIMPMVGQRCGDQQRREDAYSLFEFEMEQETRKYLKQCMETEIDMYRRDLNDSNAENLASVHRFDSTDEDDYDEDSDVEETRKKLEKANISIPHVLPESSKPTTFVKKQDDVEEMKTYVNDFKEIQKRALREQQELREVELSRKRAKLERMKAERRNMCGRIVNELLGIKTEQPDGHSSDDAQKKAPHQSSPLDDTSDSFNELLQLHQEAASTVPQQTLTLSNLKSAQFLLKQGIDSVHIHQVFDSVMEANPRGTEPFTEYLKHVEEHFVIQIYFILSQNLEKYKISMEELKTLISLAEKEAKNEKPTVSQVNKKPTQTKAKGRGPLRKGTVTRVFLDKQKPTTDAVVGGTVPTVTKKDTAVQATVPSQEGTVPTVTQETKKPTVTKKETVPAPSITFPGNTVPPVCLRTALLAIYGHNAPQWLKDMDATATTLPDAELIFKKGTVPTVTQKDTVGQDTVPTETKNTVAEDTVPPTYVLPVLAALNAFPPFNPEWLKDREETTVTQPVTVDGLFRKSEVPVFTEWRFPRRENAREITCNTVPARGILKRTVPKGTVVKGTVPTVTQDAVHKDTVAEHTVDLPTTKDTAVPTVTQVTVVEDTVAGDTASTVTQDTVVEDTVPTQERTLPTETKNTVTEDTVPPNFVLPGLAALSAFPPFNPEWLKGMKNSTVTFPVTVDGLFRQPEDPNFTKKMLPMMENESKINCGTVLTSSLLKGSVATTEETTVMEGTVPTVTQDTVVEDPAAVEEEEDTDADIDYPESSSSDWSQLDESADLEDLQ